MSRLGRVLLATAVFGLVVGAQGRPASAGDSPAATNPPAAKYVCSDSHNSDTGHGANNDAGYQSTCNPADFGGNGQESGPGLQTGKPCAGCVGNADDKNPPGQYPDGSDHNSGYECDGRDRPSADQQGNGNQGVGDENPAHTGCTSTAPEIAIPLPPAGPAPAACPGGATMPTSDQNGDRSIDRSDCTAKQVHVPSASTPSAVTAAQPAVSVGPGTANRHPEAPEVLGAGLETPSEATTPAAAAASTPSAVLGVTLERLPAASPELSPQVLGERQELGGGLPRTGPPPLLPESLFGLLLVMSGWTTVRLSRGKNGD